MHHPNPFHRYLPLFVFMSILVLPAFGEGGFSSIPPQSYPVPSDITLKLEKVAVPENGFLYTVKGQLECLIGKPREVHVWVGCTPDLSHQELPRVFNTLFQGQKREVMVSLKPGETASPAGETRIWLWIKYLPDYDALIHTVLQEKPRYPDKHLRATLLAALEKARKTAQTVQTGVSIFPREEESLDRILQDHGLKSEKGK